MNDYAMGLCLRLEIFTPQEDIEPKTAISAGERLTNYATEASCEHFRFRSVCQSAQPRRTLPCLLSSK